MKGLMIVCDQELQAELDYLLRSNGIQTYTLFKNVQGMGESGLKQGDSIGPGLNLLYWVVLEAGKLPPFLNELKTLKQKKLKQKGIQIFVIPVEASY